MDGDRTDEHPGWDDALAELLDELNAEVREANAAVDAALAEADAQTAAYLPQRRRVAAILHRPTRRWQVPSRAKDHMVPWRVGPAW